MRRFATLLLFLAVIPVTYFCYEPGLSGSFMFDDFPNIVNNTHIALQNLSLSAIKIAAYSTASGPLARPISMASFAINYYLTGIDPYFFKVTNVFIHITNGVGIYILTSLLMHFYRRRFNPELTSNNIQWLSLAVCSIWLLHPFNLTSVLFVVQRMTSLSALFCICGLVIFVYGRTKLYDGKNGFVWILLSILIFTPLAALSKETGALLPLFILVMEVCLFKFKTHEAASRGLLKILFLAAIALPAIFILSKLVMHPEIITSPYKNRDFTLAERLMTESRIMWFYMRQIILPNINQMALFHDDIPNSHGLLEPISTLFSIIGLVVLLVVAFATRKRAPLACFGILFFFAGHTLESTVFPLEITFEHRNYLPMYGLLLPFLYYLLYPIKYITTLKIRRIFSICLIALFAAETYARAGHWANPLDQAVYDVEKHPNSARYNGQMGAYFANLKLSDAALMEDSYKQARHFFEMATLLDANYTESLVALIIVSSERHKPLEKAWIVNLKHRLRYANIANNVGNQLEKLFHCQFANICAADDIELEELLLATLANPHLNGPSISIVRLLQAHYLINVTRDYPQAIKMMYLAIESSPDLVYRVSLIRFLVALERNDEAKQQLQILQSLDKLQQYDSEIKAQSKLIAGHEHEDPLK